MLTESRLNIRDFYLKTLVVCVCVRVHVYTQYLLTTVKRHPYLLGFQEQFSCLRKGSTYSRMLHLTLSAIVRSIRQLLFIRKEFKERFQVHKLCGKTAMDLIIFL